MKILKPLGMLVLAVVLVYSLALAVHYSHQTQTYHGAPVAGFTTGGASCSPICGHDNSQTR